MGKKKVLVIDDDQMVLDSVKRVLSEESYEVETTLSGRQGLEWALKRSYDLVLTDVRMPDIGGMIVLRDIKRAKPALPVMIITGYASVRSAVQAMKLGAADYIEKPFSPEELLEALDRAIEKTAGQEPEEQALVHKEELIRVLERAATDGDFVYNLLHHWADALEEFDLTAAEKLALLTGDTEWIEKGAGPLTSKQKRWLEMPLSAEMLRTFRW
ncbi:MAG: response regulator [Thermodesulfobacteriota bacterium]